MAEQLLLVLVGAVFLVLLGLFLQHRSSRELRALGPALVALHEKVKSLEAGVGQALAQGRAEASRDQRELREELAQRIELSVESFRRSIDGRLQGQSEAHRQSAQSLQTELHRNLQQVSDTLMLQLAHTSSRHHDTQQSSLSTLRTELGAQLEIFRATLEQGMSAIQTSNEQRLEAMRRTVDEKLHESLDRRLGESFQQVSDRLELVHRGLGEMQNLAVGVGDLKRLMTNVKARGTWGEFQLAGLLEELLTPDQFGTNIETRKGSGEYVEFAIRLPGRLDGDATVWLPIDAKFPQEDYQRLLEAQDRADADGVALAGKSLERAFRLAAKGIAERYLCPPETTDFGILFVPIEGLFAELLRHPGLVDGVQRDFRIAVAGPTTLGALLSSLRLGFRSLAIQKRSSEVWEILGAVKTEFEKFGGILDKAQKKVQEAGNVLDQAKSRSRAMERKLRAVEVLPPASAETVLELADPPSALDGDRAVEADF